MSLYFCMDYCCTRDGHLLYDVIASKTELLPLQLYTLLYYWSGHTQSIMVSRSEAYFSSSKARVLDQVDLSRKGSIDAAIVPLVGYLNSLEHSYTTSSCSGRLSVFCEVCSFLVPPPI